jgi:hypothetical protein
MMIINKNKNININNNNAISFLFVDLPCLFDTASSNFSGHFCVEFSICYILVSTKVRGKGLARGNQGKVFASQIIKL